MGLFNLFNEKRCISCEKVVDKLYNTAGGSEVLTSGWCEECKDKEDKKSLELLDAIRNGEDLSRFL